MITRKRADAIIKERWGNQWVSIYAETDSYFYYSGYSFTKEGLIKLLLEKSELRLIGGHLFTRIDKILGKFTTRRSLLILKAKLLRNIRRILEKLVKN